MGTCWDRPESAVKLAAFRHQNQMGLIFLHPCWLWPRGGEDEEDEDRLSAPWGLGQGRLPCSPGWQRFIPAVPRDTKQGMPVGHQGLILGT